MSTEQLKTLLFASNNPHKLKEVRDIIGQKFTLIGLEEAGIREDIPETHNTLEENASQKAWHIYRLGMPSFRRDGIHISSPTRGYFADDTGLEIAALSGRPGVHSARYAGPQCLFEDNIRKVLSEMKDLVNRRARFRTVISLIVNGKEKRFEGIVSGKMLLEKRGSAGFGYDPIFVPDGSDRSYAEMTPAEKNFISHRALAVREMMKYLSSF